MTTIDISAPTFWRDDQVRRWAAWGSDGRKVASVYGCRQSQIVGHGRSPRDVDYVSDDRIVEHAAAVRHAGLEFLYLLNGRCDHLDISDGEVRRSVEIDIEWIVEAVRPTAVVVADTRIAHLVRAKYPASDIGIKVSTIAGVSRYADLQQWLPLDISGVVLHHDCNRDFASVQDITRQLSRDCERVEVELLLNETCLPGCSVRSAHYARLARESVAYVETFQQTCNLPKFRNPALLLAASWIRPEDLAAYTELGVRRFKVAGREMSAEWADAVLTAYVTGDYHGNLVSLLTITPPGLDAATPSVLFLNNKSLDGLLDELRACNVRAYDVYRRWATTLWNEGSFVVNDPGAQYNNDPQVKCVTPGLHHSRLLEQQELRDEAFSHRRHSNRS
jgi:hypothetical protein